MGRIDSLKKEKPVNDVKEIYNMMPGSMNELSRELWAGNESISKSEITYGALLPYVNRLMDLEITDTELHDILKKLDIYTDISPITNIVLENDRKLREIFLRVK